MEKNIVDKIHRMQCLVKINFSSYFQLYFKGKYYLSVFEVCTMQSVTQGFSQFSYTLLSQSFKKNIINTYVHE